MLYQLGRMLLVITAMIILGGCGKSYTCSYKYFYMDEGVAFGGYSAGELGTIVVEQYALNSNFSTLLRSDTINASAAVFKGDTAYLSVDGNYYKSFFYIKQGQDYKVKIPVAGKEYAINLKGNKTSETWLQKEECSTGSGSTRNIPYEITVNGQDYPVYSTYPNNFFICLRR